MAKQKVEIKVKVIPIVDDSECKFCDPSNNKIGYCNNIHIRTVILIQKRECIYFEIK